MQKIIIDAALAAGIDKGLSILQRNELKVFAANTNDEILSLHRAEKANLIISRVDIAGMSCMKLLATIRNNPALRSVSLILFCQDQSEDRARAERCRPNAIMTLPVNSALLLEKAEALLNVPSRKAFRVLLRVSVDGSRRDDPPFFCKSENLSATGMLLETPRHLAKGDPLTCSFYLPDEKKITVAAEVVRVITHPDKPDRELYGVKFGPISSEDVAAIEALVKNNAV